VIFVRHPAAAVTAGTCYGRLEVGCAPGAEAEIGALLAALPPVRAVRSSPALRCRKLADRIAARDGLRVETDDRLCELNFGAWEGRQWSAIDRAESGAWAADPVNTAPPGGETFAALHTRVGEALADMPPGAVVVTHAGPIRAARMILTGASFARVFADPVPHCTPIRMRRLTRFRLESGRAEA
jgi:alpha-ribazole phosphatase